jgi:hypothetical protein
MPRVTIDHRHNASAGAVDALALTRIAPDHVITAVRDGSGNLKVIVWQVGSDGSLTRRGDASAGGVSQVAVTDWPAGPGVVTAVRTASGALKVIAWALHPDGTLHRRGDADAGAVKELSISSPGGFDGVVTPVVNNSGELEVISWSLTSSGSFQRLATGTGGKCSRITVTALSKAGGSARVAVGLRTETGDLKVFVWKVGATVARLNEATAGAVTEVAITARSTPNADVITATRGADGDLDVIGWSVADDGTLTRGAKATGGAATGLSVTTWKPDIHTYVVAGLRAADGNLKLIVWRNGADLARHGEITGVALSDVETTGWGGGVITAGRDSAGKLRLDSWGLQPAGIRLLRAQWPVQQPTVSISPSILDELDKFLGKKTATKARLQAYGERFAEMPPPHPEGDKHNG